MNLELQHFVRDALRQGKSRERIRELLRGARWHAEEIEAALEAWADGEDGLPVPRRRVSFSAREAFLHLVMFATLFIFTFDVGAILFAIIESRLRDAAMNGSAGALIGVRWALAGVITALPIFLWTTRVTDQAIARESEKRQSGVRRWLTYLTLFIAALVLIGDFIAVLNSALAGELSTRIVLKCAVVFAIALAVFGHYLAGLRREEAESDAPARRTTWIGRLGVAGTVISLLAGLVLSGAPARSRTRELDARRLDGLGQLTVSVDDFFERSGRLPLSLDELSGVQGYETQRDPETGLPYGYQPLDSLSYQVSAVFGGADTLRSYGGVIEPRWRHGRGQVWFVRKVVSGPPGRSGRPVPGRPYSD